MAKRLSPDDIQRFETEGFCGPFQVLEDVSCASVTNCAAVGFSATGPLGAPVTVVQVWDGIAWQTAPSAVAGVTASRLAGVSCVAATTVCRGVGWTELGARSTLVLIGDIS